jgi:trehalose 6-phosphate synthase/phosphatase
MNLVAKEFVAASRERGVLILSETAGSASEMGEAVIVNPNNYEQVADAIKTALDMPADLQAKALESMKRRLQRYTVHRWAEHFLEALAGVGGHQKSLEKQLLTAEIEEEIVASYGRASSRLLLLDYDGTMIPFAARPEQALPDDGLIALLRQLGMDERNTVTILSGRDRSFLAEHFGDLPLTLSAEHGAWLRPAGGDWERSEYVSSHWKNELKPLLESYVDRTPGTSLEEKEFSLVWHYRRADSELAAQRQSELREDLMYFTVNSNLAAMEGNKVLEVKNAGVTKGAIATRLMDEAAAEFVFAIGDDVTDEDTFNSLPETAVTIKVGLSVSNARLIVKDVPAARRLLMQLAAIGWAEGEEPI